jgi:hypothetical protein
MNLRRCGLVLACVLTVRAGAAIVPADFPFVQDVRAPDPLPADGTLAAVVLNDDLLAELNDPRTNLRLLEADQREIPYLIRPRTETQTRVEEHRTPGTPLSFREHPDNRAEFVVARPDGSGAPVALLLHSAQANYEKLISIHGSTDQQQWTLLTEAQPIFDYTRYIDVRNNRVNLPPGPWTFYRIDIANLAEDRKAVFTDVIRQVRGGEELVTETETARIRREPFRVDRLEWVVRDERVLAERPLLAQWKIAEFDVQQDESAKVSRIEFTTRRQPLVALWLFPEDRNFSRHVTVSASDQPGTNAAWLGLANATLTRIEAAPGHEPQLKLDLGGPRRFLRYRITISNHDNPPLAIASIQAEAETWEALFFPPPGPMSLYYGGTFATAPRYDIGAVLAARPRLEPVVWRLGPPSPNPAYREPTPLPPARSGKTIMIAAIIVMVGLLFLLIAKSAKQVE